MKCCGRCQSSYSTGETLPFTTMSCRVCERSGTSSKSSFTGRWTAFYVSLYSMKFLLSFDNFGIKQHRLSRISSLVRSWTIPVQPGNVNRRLLCRRNCSVVSLEATLADIDKRANKNLLYMFHAVNKRERKRLNQSLSQRHGLSAPYQEADARRKWKVMDVLVPSVSLPLWKKRKQCSFVLKRAVYSLWALCTKLESCLAVGKH